MNRALTRRAYGLEQKQQNQECEDQEIYRVLGDAVLRAVLVDLLIKSGCSTREEITTKKQRLEREEMLDQIGRKLSIGPFIKLGIGEKKQNADQEPKVIAETLEAIIGSIYVDGGYETAKSVIAQWFKDLFI
ncbi:MAG: ribonuclease III domain-containing protein [candidate division WOR-3 bacterium]|nr:ribonuclease III domain-containing protein [candidate division WOR-3 bacterium]